MPDRLTRIRAAIAEEGLDGLLISAPRQETLGQANRRYASGFTGSTGVVLVTAERAVVAVDFRYIEQAERECSPRGFEVFAALHSSKKWFPELMGHVRAGGKKLGLSRDDLAYGDFLALQGLVEAMPSLDRPELVAAPPIVERLRRVKDGDELGLLQRAIDIGDRSFERARETIQAGQTETAIADGIEAAYREFGADGPSFSSIVAGGAWSAMPHASPRPQPVHESEPIVIDMGARYRGYCSDLTRTITIGAGEAKFGEIYAIVLEAQQTAIERVEAGMTGVQAHALAADVIARHGYGEQFGHGLGHGVGLEVHEDPYLGPSSEDTLEDGMVFTIEPGIYIPGWGGVRIEDVVVLENGRACVLSHASKLIPAGV